LINPLSSAKLAIYLRRKDPLLYGRVVEVRDVMEAWLEYIPATFPHYTRHTVSHSDEIVRQLSQLLFEPGKRKPTIELSPTEVYILIVAAYLHDAGMVVSPQEVSDLLAAEAWKQWTAIDANARRLETIDQLRADTSIPTQEQRHFLADLQLRFLVAEFIRGQHHRRSGRIITLREQQIAQFALGDQSLLLAISHVCEAHGLRQHELEQHHIYPDDADIRGDAVNVRLLALLLRIADLLDTSTDRACPLLLNAASPLPGDSLAHWTQHQCFVHRRTRPDSIELDAECRTLDEHRVAMDWCRWLVDEINGARALVPAMSRHRDWIVPKASLEGENPTIHIVPAANTTYIFSNWRFELDTDVVLERLAKETYTGPYDFIRELIQNALDATRCRMYLDAKADGLPLPRYPTQFEDDIRSKYPIHITLRTENSFNELSGNDEPRQILTIEDHGVGMDREVIEKYFLQVGRSYYTTSDFRDRFPFYPSSRFGVGFLSVFGSSDHVRVETLRESSPDGPILLTLKGFRTYFLTERGSRSEPGTRIDVELTHALHPGELTRLVRRWCTRVEFPLEVIDLDATTVIHCEGPSSYVTEFTDPTREDATIGVKAFPIPLDGVEGEAYAIVHSGPDGEDWTRAAWAADVLPRLHPLAPSISLPHADIAVGGISLGFGYHQTGFALRADYRRIPPFDIPMHRTGMPTFGDPDFRPDSDLQAFLDDLLSSHLDTSPMAAGKDAWRYKLRLIRSFPLHAFWRRVPDVMRAFRNGESALYSLDKLQSDSVLSTVSAERYHDTDLEHDLPTEQNIASRMPGTTLLEGDIDLLGSERRSWLLGSRKLSGVEFIDGIALILHWQTSPAPQPTSIGARQVWLVPMPSHILALQLPDNQRGYGGILSLNASHELTQWILRLTSACLRGDYGLASPQTSALMTLIDRALAVWIHGAPARLQAYLDKWRALTDLPADLLPPELYLTLKMVVPNVFALIQIP
jgi:hypothetical protein